MMNITSLSSLELLILILSLSLMYQLCEGVAFCHGRRMLHRCELAQSGGVCLKRHCCNMERLLLKYSLWALIVLAVELKAYKACFEKERIGLLELKSSVLDLSFNGFNGWTDHGDWVQYYMEAISEAEYAEFLEKWSESGLK